MISTKKGDLGFTSLANGERVDKDNLRVEAYGTIDELVSNLGIARAYLSGKIRDIIEEIQKDLFRMATELAKGEKFVKLIDNEDVERVTKYVEDFEKDLNLNTFVIPGMKKESAYMDVCRTIARRAERNIVRLSKNEKIRKEILAYINRVSDLFYVIARYLEKDEINKIKVSEL
ncbi:ATP--cobalamin adenosyltransferase [Thermosipho melanesiensis]|uniref:Corrinoid adenosyltransferase n=2 Tax=Thermosipho melanesiensis TaxID=46541 RepID=A6LNW2_THEM4|nr:cob(I)yrinic acid a,c-diamide adenosyltransferase [Thermosipho melanesiensis]ABR31613.1 ATP--cobalamin adenosyltransferase [Thermosipho melanesiensis BI429]OOC35141.1 ATP--cobalamin adenosyltransferase [Thermosipho melanesiensis]OOC35351.1 ATP--cobalamin adenosyltransferase [Thermosipho melanesiensis]OOC36602.1 ATP--cobalamin adenosyltransferase [Thermosipho melanesiensis]OOC39923.1 ATP--cobalamin adenosyltransferase [Thermosipho melanesiensis]